MYYYSFHVGDYSTHTKHLTPMEDLAYRRLLDAYYVREGPLHGKPVEIARLINLREHAGEVETVLREFFREEAEGVWRHGRCDAELDRCRERTAMAAKAGRISAARRKGNGRSTDVEQALNERSTDVQRDCNGRSTTHYPLPITQDPEPNTQKNTGAARSARALAVRPDEVNEQVWTEFQALRKARRAPVTQTVVDGIRREADAAGVTLAEAMRTCVERGWQSFKADWMLNGRAGGQAKATGGFVPKSTPLGSWCAPGEDPVKYDW